MLCIFRYFDRVRSRCRIIFCYNFCRSGGSISCIFLININIREFFFINHWFLCLIRIFAGFISGIRLCLTIVISLIIFVRISWHIRLFIVSRVIVFVVILVVFFSLCTRFFARNRYGLCIITVFSFTSINNFSRSIFCGLFCRKHLKIMTKCLFEVTFFLVATARTFPEYISCFCACRLHYLHFLHLMFFTTYLDILIRIFGFCCRSNTYLCRLNINRRTSDHRHNKQNCKNSTLSISSHTNFLLCIEIR